MNGYMRSALCRSGEMKALMQSSALSHINDAVTQPGHSQPQPAPAAVPQPHNNTQEDEAHAKALGVSAKQLEQLHVTHSHVRTSITHTSVCVHTTHTHAHMAARLARKCVRVRLDVNGMVQVG